MKITFVSNYLNHHQIPFCEKLIELTNNDFTFVAMEPMAEERKKMGWGIDKLAYEIRFSESQEEREKATKLFEESDVVIYGGGSYARYLNSRIKQKKLTFLNSERVYRNGLYRVISPRGQYYMRKYNTRYKKDNLFLLCASAYAPFDYGLVGAYKNKSFKWGYFPKTMVYDTKELFDLKQNKKLEILWVSRFIPLKHPEKIVKLAKKLTSDGYNFHVTMIGIGPEKQKTIQSVVALGLNDKFTFIDSMPPLEVRKYMEKSNIFLFTSDYREGWGAVLNEAMNSGCAVVASHAIGATPYLIKDGENGLVYKDNNFNDFYRCVKLLIDDRNLANSLGLKAYEDIITTWNAENAATKLYEFCENFLLGKQNPRPSIGPMSKAKNICQYKMYKMIKEKRVWCQR